MDENENSNENPFDLFVSECNNVDIEVRINSIKRLPTVAVALDTERTKTELLPYLDNLTEGIYNDDEVLMNLAEQLGGFLPFVGGTENAHLILSVLEKLASIEENVVRQKAIESLRNIAASLDKVSLETIFIPLVFRLADSEWFTSKSAATSLFAVCYHNLSEDVQGDLRNAYRVLCQDESPLVRRSAATRLSKFAKVLDVQHIKDEFIPVFDNFSKDDQDSVRVLAVDVGISLALRLKKKEVEEFILTTLTELCGDVSWRVRYQVSYQINAMQMALGPELTRKYLVAIYQNLVHDTEPQVREAAAKAIVGFCQMLQESYKESNEDAQDQVDPTILNLVLPLIEYLDQDANPEVKEALSMVITSLSPLLGVENTKTLLLPLVTNSLLNDSSRVRENIISNLNNIISVIGISDIAETVLKIVVDLVNNSASGWRTRRNLVVTINYIAKHSGKKYFDEHLKMLYHKLLSDGVYAVRKTAPLILPILVKNFGFAWASNSLVPVFLVFAEHKHYLYRFVCLFCIDELVSPTLEAKFESATTEDDIQSQNRLKYLQHIRQFAQNHDVETQNTVAKLVRQIRKLSNELKVKLEQDWVMTTLKEVEDNYFSNDDIKRYAEDTIEMFVRDNNLDICSVSKEEIFAQESDVYLEGVLGVASQKFLGVLRSLATDPVTNIRLKTAETLKKLIQFNTTLQAELKETWVQQIAPSENDEDDVTMTDEPKELDFSLAKVEENHEPSQEEIKEQTEIVRKTEEVAIVDEGPPTETTTITNESEDKTNVEPKHNPDATIEEKEETEETFNMSIETELIEILDEKLAAEKNSTNQS